MKFNSVNRAEARLLEAIAGSQFEIMEGKKHVMSDHDVTSFFAEVKRNEQQRLSRRGTTGNWCFFCGESVPTGTCGCSFAESLRCSQRRVCAACAEAHRIIGSHLERMFLLPRVDRVSSRRNRAYHQLHGAALDLAEIDPASGGEEFKFQLAQADSYDDEPEAFRRGVLRAFQQTRRLDYRNLAARLQKNLNDYANRTFRELLKSIPP
jgi:hypothetical protein